MLKKLLSISALTAILAVPCYGQEGCVVYTDALVGTDSIALSVKSDTAAEAVIYGAAYDDEGLLVSQTNTSAALTAGVNEITFSKPTGGTRLKVMVWDSLQRPLGSTYVENISVDSSQGDGIIHLLGDSIDATGVSGVSVNGTILTIKSVGTYTIEGTLNDGQIVVSEDLGKKDEVTINLNGVNVTSSTSAPFNGAGGKLNIVLGEGTTNTFTDTSAYADYTSAKDPKGCVYSRRDLAVSGTGKLVVNGNVKMLLYAVPI